MRAVELRSCRRAFYGQSVGSQSAGYLYQPQKHQDQFVSLTSDKILIQTIHLLHVLFSNLKVSNLTVLHDAVLVDALW